MRNSMMMRGGGGGECRPLNPMAMAFIDQQASSTTLGSARSDGATAA